MWAAIDGCSGLLALSLEIVWFRMLGVMMKSTAFTFGTLLALYLSGLGLGSLVGSAIAPRIRSPAAAFLKLQAAVGLCAGGLLALFIAVVDDTQSLHGYERLGRSLIFAQRDSRMRRDLRSPVRPRRPFGHNVGDGSRSDRRGGLDRGRRP
jgi:hypothetical protein